jgi:hypothetical protein
MITAAGIRTAGGEAEAQARAFTDAAARHAAAARALRVASARVERGWVSPAAAPVAAALTADEAAHGDVATALEGAAGSLRALARTAATVAAACGSRGW